MSPTPPSTAIIGGGIAGLAAALELHSSERPFTLYESAPRVGGVLRTTYEDDCLLEHSADNFITNLPEAVDLCRRVGLADQLLNTNSDRRGAEIVHRGKLYRVPEGFMLMAPHDAWQVWRSPLLSWPGKLRLLSEFLVPRRSPVVQDESLASFVTRRLGREAFERLVQPLIGGIYTADANKLSMAAALTRFWEMEQKHGGLMRAVWKDRKRQPSAESAGSGARYSLFMAPRLGMQQLIDALAAQLPPMAIRLNSAVESLAHRDGFWQVSIADGTVAEHQSIIVAAPAPHASRLLRDTDQVLADELAGIPYAGTALALATYRTEQIGRPLRSFGFVVPEIEQRDILAASFSSLKFPGRAPNGRVLIRVFLGGAKRPDLVQLDDQQIRQIVTRELGELLAIQGEPERLQVKRWHGAMPQYHVGHLERLARIDVRLQAFPTLALAGNAYRGVGIPQCIASGFAAARKVLSAAPSSLLR